jgi:hypothetical protein
MGRGETLSRVDWLALRQVRCPRREIWLDDQRRLGRRRLCGLGGLSDFGDDQACD